MKSIQPMTKVNLSFTAATGPGKEKIPLDPGEYEFVFGIGSGGLTPFEYELAEKTAGDQIEFCLRDSQMPTFFAHHCPPVTDLFSDHPELFLTARINSVETAEGRDIIKAMAEMTARSEGSCNCGGSCGCG